MPNTKWLHLPEQIFLLIKLNTCAVRLRPPCIIKVSALKAISDICNYFMHTSEVVWRIPTHKDSTFICVSHENTRHKTIHLCYKWIHLLFYLCTCCERFPLLRDSEIKMDYRVVWPLDYLTCSQAIPRIMDTPRDEIRVYNPITIVKKTVKTKKFLPSNIHFSLFNVFCSFYYVVMNLRNN